MTKQNAKTKRPVAHSMNEATARAAFELLRPTLEAMPREGLTPIRLDVQLAAAIAHSVGIRDGAEPRRTRLQAVAKSGLFDLADFDRLPNVALAVWHARQQQQRTGALSSEAVVPVVIVKDAQAVRGRMLRVLEHYFDDDAEVGPRLLAIRSGGGLQDLANDLEQLADLYEEDDVRPVIIQDTKHWRNEDGASARRFAQAIFRGLGLGTTGDAAQWADLTQRAWTLLDALYADVRATGRFVFRKDEDVEITYPSLVAATRSSASRPKDDLERATPPAPAPSHAV
ncbi:MAG: hypothetical protein KF894_14820 [Labilithrix sp.]|nr:hypothetical protein [Labilithrix sp.]